MKIATWNVNSLNVRLPQVLEWLTVAQPDILALQETKLTDDKFPHDQIKAAGYHAVCSGQKTYNGVAILSKLRGESEIRDIPELDDHQRRVLGLTCGELRILNLYVPNGESVGSQKYEYKMNWLERLIAFVSQEIEHHPNLVVLGDFNIAPDERDVHDPVVWQGRIMFSEAERSAFRRLLEAGLVDAFRLFDQPPEQYTWWDYRMGAFRRNLGLRIDHILASRTMAQRCRACVIDKAPRKNERPSDHTPVMAEFT